MVDFVYNPDEYKEKTFDIIPEGDYRLRISEVEEKTFKSGNEGYRLSFDVQGQDSKLFYNLVINKGDSSGTNQRIGALFNSFGITDRRLGSGAGWVGKAGAAHVKHDEYDGKKYAAVAWFINKAKQDALPKWDIDSVDTWKPAPPDELPF